jgi:glycerol uptake facilitator-like aquaporin
MLKLTQRLNTLGAMTGAAFVMGTLSSSDAHAGQSFNNIGSNVTAGIASLPGLLTAISYIMGLIFAVLGVLKIKDHVENPSQTQLKDGAIRLAVGGALFALPIVTSSMQNLINAGDSGAINANTLNRVQMSVN